MTTRAAAATTERLDIGTFQKNTREEVRVTLETFHGREILNVRVWFRAEGGEMLPSQKGLALSVERLPDLLEVLMRAMETVSPTGKPAA